MYGLVNLAVEDLVTQRYGLETWHAIQRRAGAEGQTYLKFQPYPDELTYALVSAASEVLAVPSADVLRTFGEYWIEYAQREAYGSLMRLSGRDLPSFLQNLDALHARLEMTFPGYAAPSFRVTDLEPGSLRLHYVSERPGLAPFVEGLLRGLGSMFGEEVDVSLLESRETGADHDVFLVHHHASSPASSRTL